MKLIKITDIHYIITDDYQLKEGDNQRAFNTPDKTMVVNDIFCMCALEDLSRITHSTLPLFSEEFIKEVDVSKDVKVELFRVEEATGDVIVFDINEIPELDSDKSSWDIKFVEGKIKVV